MSGKYKKIKLKDGSTIDEHRHIMQQKLGRKLKFNEVVHHKDGIKSNNDISNLKIESRSKHSREFMLEHPELWIKNPDIKLNETLVLEIRKLLPYLPNIVIAEKFGVSRWTINDIRRGKRWKGVTEKQPQ